MDGIITLGQFTLGTVEGIRNFGLPVVVAELDYCINTPEGPLRAYACMQQRIDLNDKNLQLLQNSTGLLAPRSGKSNLF